jgi:hypothetical protein
MCRTKSQTRHNERQLQTYLKGNQPPARAEDLVPDLVQKLKIELKICQATELQSIRESIEKRPASFRE